MNKLFKFLESYLALGLMFLFCSCLILMGVATQMFFICVIGTIIPFLYIITVFLCRLSDPD